MSLDEKVRVISGDAPDTATGAAIGSASGLSPWWSVLATAKYAGNTGGSLDVYVQRYDRKLEAWVDWIHFPQAAAGAASASYVCHGIAAPQAIYAVGLDDAPALANNSFTGGHPGDKVRVWAVSGASTSAGATVTVSFYGLQE